MRTRLYDPLLGSGNFNRPDEGSLSLAVEAPMGLAGSSTAPDDVILDDEPSNDAADPEDAVSLEPAPASPAPNDAPDEAPIDVAPGQDPVSDIVVSPNAESQVADAAAPAMIEDDILAVGRSLTDPDPLG